MKKIQTKIVVVILCVVLVLCMLFGIVASVLNSSTANEVLKQSLMQSAGLASEIVHIELEKVQQVAAETGSVARFSNPETTLTSKQAIIKQKIDTYKFIGGNILDLSGTSLIDGKNYADRDYFKASVAGKTFISGPLISKVTGEYSIMISAPIWKGGAPNTMVTGVVYFKPNINILSDIVDKI